MLSLGIRSIWPFFPPCVPLHSNMGPEAPYLFSEFVRDRQQPVVQYVVGVGGGREGQKESERERERQKWVEASRGEPVLLAACRVLV